MGDEEKLDELLRMVTEVHQRQTERTIPAIERIEHTIYGNGKVGLCQEVNNIKTTVTVLRWVGGAVATVLAIVIAGLGLLLRST